MSKGSKELFSYLLTLVMVISMVCTNGMTAQAAVLTNNGATITETTGNITVSTVDGQTVYTLKGNVENGLSLTLSDGETAVLDGKGYSISGKWAYLEDSATPALSVSGTGTLIVENASFCGGDYACQDNTACGMEVFGDVNVILRGMVFITGGSAYGDSKSCVTYNGQKGMNFAGKDLIIDSYSTVTIFGSNGAKTGRDSWYPYGGKGGDGGIGLSFEGERLIVNSNASLTLWGGSGGDGSEGLEINESQYTDSDYSMRNGKNGGNGGAGMLFNGQLCTIAADAEVSARGGAAGYGGGAGCCYDDCNNRMDNSYGTPGKDGTAGNDFTYQNGLFDKKEWLKKAGVDYKTVTLHYPAALQEESSCYYTGQGSTLNCSILPYTENEKFQFDDWYSDDVYNSKVIGGLSINEDTSLYAKYKQLYCDIAFDTNDGSVVAAQSVSYNSVAKEPTAPTKEGCTFAGWYTDAACTEIYNFATPVIEDITLYAKWAHVVTFETNGGSDVKEQKVAENTTAQRPADPTKTGYTFAGWYSDKVCETEYRFDKAVTSDITLYAKWDISKCIVTFNTNGGTTVAAQSVSYNSVAEKPTAPTKTGHSFAGWYTDKGCTKEYKFTEKVTDAITLYAKWDINYYNVTFNANGGSTVAAQSVSYNSVAKEPTEPTKTGYTFAGWYEDTDCTVEYTFKTPVTSDITVYAKWTKNEEEVTKTYTVTFDTNGGSGVEAQSVSENNIAERPADPTREGYTFAGWYENADCTVEYTFKTPVISDITVYAKWTKNEEEVTKTYTVTFDTNGGSGVEARSVLENSIAERPADPTREGYTFAGWYTDQACTKTYDFATPVTSDIALYAKWNKNAVADDDKGNTGNNNNNSGSGSNSGSGDNSGSGAGNNEVVNYEVSFNTSSVVLQKGKSTSKVKAIVMEGDAVAGYTSSNTKVATVNQNGKITAKNTGKATITVTTVKGATATITVKVQKSKVTTKKVTVTNVEKKTVTLKKGEKFTLDVLVEPVTSVDKVTYTTSNKKVATVSKSGKIKAVGKGTAKITVKSGTKKIVIKVKVTK